MGRAGGVVFTDGRVVGAALDRNGLRPLRVAVATTAWSSARPRREPSTLPTGARVRRGKLGPGEMLAVDPRRGVETTRAIKRRLARGGPTAAGSRTGACRIDAGEPVPPPDEDLTRGRSLPATRARS